MLSATRVMLDEFYRPYNEQLGMLLGNLAFTWTNSADRTHDAATEIA